MQSYWVHRIKNLLAEVELETKITNRIHHIEGYLKQLNYLKDTLEQEKANQLAMLGYQYYDNLHSVENGYSSILKNGENYSYVPFSFKYSSETKQVLFSGSVFFDFNLLDTFKTRMSAKMRGERKIIKDGFCVWRIDEVETIEDAKMIKALIKDLISAYLER